MTWTCRNWTRTEHSLLLNYSDSTRCCSMPCSFFFFFLLSFLFILLYTKEAKCDIVIVSVICNIIEAFCFVFFPFYRTSVDFTTEKNFSGRKFMWVIISVWLKWFLQPLTSVEFLLFYSPQPLNRRRSNVLRVCRSRFRSYQTCGLTWSRHFRQKKIKLCTQHMHREFNNCCPTSLSAGNLIDCF